MISDNPKVRLLLAAGVALAPWLILGFTTYDEICSKNQYTGNKDCTIYYSALVWLWHLGEALNYYGAAITAIFTGFVAAFTWRLFRSTSQLQEISQQEFFATHPAKLVVRRVVFVDGVDGKQTRISYAVTNIGDTDAQIEDSEVRVHIYLPNERLPVRPPYNYPGNNVLWNIKLKVGDTYGGNAESPDLQEQLAVVERQDRYRVMLVGWLLYKNPGGKRGYTAFARVYDQQARGFIKPNEHENAPEYDRYNYMN